MVPWKLGSLFIQACLACIALTRIVHAVSVPCPSGLNASMHARPHYIMCLHNPLELVSSAIYSAGYWGECEMYPFIIYDSLKRSVADGIVSGQSQETHRVTLPAFVPLVPGEYGYSICGQSNPSKHTKQWGAR